MLSELVSQTEAPETIVIIASVTTNGIISRLGDGEAVDQPDQTHGRDHDDDAERPVAAGFHRDAPSTAPSAILAGSDRSIPPTIITIVIPIARRPSSEA